MGSECRPAKHNYQSFILQNKFQQLNQKYSFGKCIGKGSYSQVKVVLNNHTKQKYAAKIIDKAQILRENLYQDILRQKTMLLKLQKGGQKTKKLYVQLIQSLQDREKLYFILQYMPFGSLRTLLKSKRKLDEKKAKFICMCILLGLQNLQKLNIIHGDIKPQNILIDEKGYFRIADFSSARAYGSQASSIKGTTGYSAPELRNLQENKLHNNKSDIYSLGVIIWEILHGTKYNSYMHKQLPQLSLQLTNDNDSENSFNEMDLTPQCQNFLQLLIKQNPDQRPNIQYLWSHPWLIEEKEQIKRFYRQNLSHHPFQPIDEYFKYSTKQNISTRRSTYDDDDLVSSVMLNQKKIQELFSNFNSSKPPGLLTKRSF